MPRNVFYRDFSICKAVALVALMGLAVAMGGVPRSGPVTATEETPEAMVIPAMVYSVWKACDPAETGIEL